MALSTYRRKRDFAATPEPKGRKSRRKGDSFVIQKHDATRLHYDLRLELGGVLKSWAVTRGPSLVAGEKRLAVEVEDHPLDYGDFEGTIPKGEYGGGTVLLWDRGRWSPLADPVRGLKKGHLEFELEGEKLSGRWHLVRMERKPREKRDNWLLIKADDESARARRQKDILKERPESVKTGRQMKEIAGEEPGWSSKSGDLRAKAPELPKAARKARLPAAMAPQLATLAASPPSGKGWLHEIKFDGYRVIARLSGGKIKLLTRSGLDWTKRFGSAIPDALAALPATNALIDGEIVVETGNGASDFSALQADLSEGREDRFIFYAFDLMHLDGHDLRPVPLIERKAMLETLMPAGEGGVLRYSGYFDESGALVLDHACRLSLEGVISKKADAPYRPGRGKSWIKSKCSARQEFVVAGFTPSSAVKGAIGSLVLGVHEKGDLVHVGRVGTGFSAKAARDLHARLKKMASEDSPFAARLDAEARRNVTFVRPELVAEVEFRGWTGAGNLRHAAFRGLREDKPASEIVRETGKSKAKATVQPPKRSVKLTHPDRIYWPKAGVSKEGLADYYAQMWRLMAPHVVGRPLALLRAPTGIGGQTFFQKHGWKGMNANIRKVPDPKDKTGEAYIAIDDFDGLAGLVQSAALEIHPWGASLADWERPDMIVMDLDPGPGVTWEEVVSAAREVAERLRGQGLEPFVKTSGGKGFHVVAPLKPKAGWPAVKTFSKALAEAMASDDPDRYVATIAKAKRRGRILIDYLRNQRGATAVAPYSTRAREGAPVSMPLAWDEVGAEIGPAHFNVLNAPARIAALDADPWGDFRKAAAELRPYDRKKS